MYGGATPATPLSLGAYSRIVVIGTSGSGKTTLAKAIAQRLHIPHIELDALHWEANWTGASREVFRQRVAAAVAADTWAVCGNYSAVRDLVWARAHVVVWLDYAFPVVVRRVIWRTLRRAIAREELWNGNRERLRQAFFSRDSIIVWSLTTYHRRRREYPALLARSKHAHLAVVRLRSPRETQDWLKHIPHATEDATRPR